MRQRLCKVCDDWHDLGAPWPHNCLPEAPQRSDLAAPQVIRNSAEPFLSHADNRMYSCKRAYERETRALGFEIVGNEKLKPAQKVYDDRGLKDALKRAAEEQGL